MFPLELLIITACIETSEGCGHLSDFYFKHKGYDQIYDAFTRRYKRELELGSPLFTLGTVAVNRRVTFKYRPFTINVSNTEQSIGFNYDF